MHNQEKSNHHETHNQTSTHPRNPILHTRHYLRRRSHLLRARSWSDGSERCDIRHHRIRNSCDGAVEPSRLDRCRDGGRGRIMGAVGYARRFANLPTAAEYQERHPNVELLTFEQASEHTGRKIASLKSSLNKVSNRLVPVALTNERDDILFSRAMLDAWHENTVKNRARSRAYFTAQDWRTVK